MIASVGKLRDGAVFAHRCAFQPLRWQKPMRKGMAKEGAGWQGPWLDDDLRVRFGHVPPAALSRPARTKVSRPSIRSIPTISPACELCLTQTATRSPDSHYAQTGHQRIREGAERAAVLPTTPDAAHRPKVTCLVLVPLVKLLGYGLVLVLWWSWVL